MTTFTGASNFSKPFSYKPEDDPAFQDADTKALLSGAAQASLSRLAKPGGVWNQEDFSKITQHYMKPIQEQTKQRSEALQAFFRSRGWMDSGGAPEKQLKLFEAAERQAAENVYVPLTLEALRQRDTTAQADIAQAAGLGQQRLASYLQGRGQQFQEYSTGRQLEQTDQQLAVQLRGMAVQERNQLLNEVNSSYERARAAGEQTGVYTDPQTGQSMQTLQAKRDQLARVSSLHDMTGAVPLDIAREAGVSEEELGAIRLGDFLSPEEIAALGGTPPAGGAAQAGGAAGSALSPAQQSYVDSLAPYELTPEEQGQVQSLFLSGSPTALLDIHAIAMTAYNRKNSSGTTPPAGGGELASEPSQYQTGLLMRAYEYDLTADEVPAVEQAVRSGDFVTYNRIVNIAKARQGGIGVGGVPPEEPSAGGTQQWDYNSARNYFKLSEQAASGNADAVESLRILQGQMVTADPPTALLNMVAQSQQPPPEGASPGVPTSSEYPNPLPEGMSDDNQRAVAWNRLSPDRFTLSGIPGYETQMLVSMGLQSGSLRWLSDGRVLAGDGREVATSKGVAPPVASSPPSSGQVGTGTGRTGDPGTLLGLGGGEPWADETAMRYKISSLLKQKFGVDAGPGSDLVSRLYRGDTVTV